MIEINLLPKDLRKGKGVFTFKKNTAYLLGGGGILLILLIFISILQGVRLQSLNRKIAEGQRRKEELKESIRLVDALEELKTKILQRLSAIEALDKDRSTWVDIMEDLSSRIPDYLWLSAFKEIPPVTPVAAPGVQNPEGETADTLKKTQAPAVPPPDLGRKVTIEGYTFSLNSLATFMINLMRSSYFKNIELNYVKLTDLEKQKAYSFQLTSDLFYTSQLPAKEKLVSATQTEISSP
ncbi:MAG TPA: PilN domain-containing protein [Terriglobales bacterium]|nr:PilN domain-containing protein [Terriglobales bacterium]